MCPFCLSIVATAEGELVSHVLAEHPEAFLASSLALVIAHIALRNRPRQLVLVNGGLLLAAMALARGHGKWL